MLFPFRWVCTHERAHAFRTRSPLCSVACVEAPGVHTSRAVSTILKGSCRSRTFPAGRNREQLTPRLHPLSLRLFPSSVSSYAYPSSLSIFRVTGSRFLSFPRFVVGNQCGECTYTQWRRVCLPSARREQEERNQRGGEEDGRRRRQLEATETSCIPGH